MNKLALLSIFVIALSGCASMQYKEPPPTLVHDSQLIDPSMLQPCAPLPLITYLPFPMGDLMTAYSELQLLYNDCAIHNDCLIAAVKTKNSDACKKPEVPTK